MGKLSGKIALITGAGRGIGRATARLFAEQDASIVLVARSQDQLAETKRLCRAYLDDSRLLTQTADLADGAQIERLFDQIDSRFRGLDIVINNAAQFAAGDIATFPVEKLQALFAVNVTAPLRIAQLALPLMRIRGGGNIVNVSSLSGVFGTAKFPGFGAYNMSKYALWGLTEILALELRRDNVRVNQISLGGVDTEMFRKAVPPGAKAALTPEMVAARILYLVSDESAPLTGENLIFAEPED